MLKSYKVIRKATPVAVHRRHRGTIQNVDLLQHPRGLSYDGEQDGGSGRERSKPRTRDLLGLPQDETRRMYIEQRELEQAGHRRLAKVNAREKLAEIPAGGPQASEGYQEHPLLSKSPRWDGAGDPNVNPSAAIAEKDPWLADELKKEKARQEHDKELRLSLQKENRHEYAQANRSTPTLSR